ncbi:MAG: hypothetical protein JOY99_01050 [Sphingomonadaceae bacterium]|nr:hypothetical protein [Sphingomonadaceae bacterium]
MNAARVRTLFARTSIELRSWLAGVALGLAIAAPHLLGHEHVVAHLARLFG